MLDLDLSEQIRALRSTFADIRAVVDVDRLTAEISRLSELAEAPDLWDDTANAQKVTSELSHRQAELTKINSIESRLDDLEVLIDMANEAGDEDSAKEAEVELASITAVLGELEVQTLLNGEYDSYPAVITIRSGAGGVDAGHGRGNCGERGAGACQRLDVPQLSGGPVSTTRRIMSPA